jgi:hypothetical protein
MSSDFPVHAPGRAIPGARRARDRRSVTEKVVIASDSEGIQTKGSCCGLGRAQ